MMSNNFEIEDETRRCPECDGFLISDTTKGEIYCKNCGIVVVDEILDSRPKRRFPDEPDKGHSGPPMTFMRPDKGLGTTISRTNKDFMGNNLSERTKRTFYNLRKWDNLLSISNSRRSLSKGISEIERICDKLKLHRSVREQSCFLMRKVIKHKLIHQRNVECCAAAVVLLACRSLKLPLSIKDIDKISDGSKKYIFRYSQLFIRELKISNPLISPEDYLPRFCSDLNLSMKTQEKALEILKRAKDQGLFGKGSSILGDVAAAIYLACQLTGELRTQSDISSVCSITEITIRKRMREFSKYLEINIKH